jgi:hypothetical protein
MVRLTKKRRGPKPTGQGKNIGTRIHPPELAALSLPRLTPPRCPRYKHIVGERDGPWRPEMIRRILVAHLKRCGPLAKL